MTNITATVITHNEQRNIERCLNALIGVADEIVVVDSNSTDATVEICSRYGCRIVARPFAGYGSQRQFATSLATHRYILSIDADEVLSDDLRQAIIDLKTDDSLKTHRMYGLRMVSYVCGRPVGHSGFGPHLEVRLFDKRYATWDLRDVGERVSHSDSVVPATLPGCIHHYRCHSIDELRYKELRHAAIKARVLAAGKNSIGILTPWLKAARAFLHCHLRQGALLDGREGRRIAGVRYAATLAAYSDARKIKKHTAGAHSKAASTPE